MIHNLSALPAGMPAIQAQGAKAAKGGVEAAILALFSKALATQLQAGEAATPPAAAPASVSALSVPLLPDASLVAVAAPSLKGEGAVEQANPAATLATESLVDPSQLPGLASIAVVAVPSQAPGQPQKQPESVVAAASLLAAKQQQTTPEPVVAAASLLAAAKPGLAAKSSQTAPEPVLTAETAEDSPDLELVPAVAKNPLVLAGMKNLPVTPAGIAANTHHFQNAPARELPAGIQMKVGQGEVLDLKGLVPSLEDGTSLPPVSGAQNLADGAKLVSTPTPFSALPVQAQGEALGLSLGASRQVAQLVTPFTQPQWQSELADKVVWLAGRQSHVAALSLNPPSLGNIEVRLNLSGSDAGAQFFSANPTVREAIEAALPRLREMMAEAGLSLGQATVSSEPFRDREATAQRAEGGGGEDESEGVLALASGLGQGRPRSGLVDLYV